ncbi:hypothetical protein Tco_0767206 [Tanacetum coccineum]
MSMTIQSSVKDKILATSSETSKVENTPAEMLRDLDQQMEKRADDGKANVVTDALSRKERVKPRRVRAMAMIIQYGVRGMILAAQSEAFKQENTLQKVLEARLGFEYCLHPQADGQMLMYDSGLWEGYNKGMVIDFGCSYHSALCDRLKALLEETTDKVVLIIEKLKAARDRQKSCADNRRKPLEFEVGERGIAKSVTLECVIRFGKIGLADVVACVLDEIKVDKTLCFVKEPVENSDREVKRLKCSRMMVVKQPEVIPVFSFSNKSFQIPHQPSLEHQLIYLLDLDAGPLPVQSTPISFWQILHPLDLPARPVLPIL